MAIKIILKSVGKLSFFQLRKLTLQLLKHPLFSIQTFVATLRTFQLSRKYFPNTHYQNGRGNAFRHALWCCLIMMYCCKVSSPQKSKIWCKKITDLHEDLFINEPILRAMDLHNNQIGINLFMEMLNGIHRQFFERSFFIEPLLNKTKNAVLISKIEDIIPEKMAITEDID